MSIERGPVKHPRISSMAYPYTHPFRICVLRVTRGEWVVMQEHLVLATHPTHAEAFADAWARTHPKEEA